MAAHCCRGCTNVLVEDARRPPSPTNYIPCLALRPRVCVFGPGRGSPMVCGQTWEYRVRQAARAAGAPQRVGDQHACDSMQVGGRTERNVMVSRAFNRYYGIVLLFSLSFCFRLEMSSMLFGVRVFWEATEYDWNCSRGVRKDSPCSCLGQKMLRYLIICSRLFSKPNAPVPSRVQSVYSVQSYPTPAISACDRRQIDYPLPLPHVIVDSWIRVPRKRNIQLLSVIAEL